MVVITVETTIIASIPFIWISLHLAGEGQGFFILNLHQNLVDQGSQRRETCEFSYRGLETPVLPLFFNPSHLLPLSYLTSSYLSCFLSFSSRASNTSSAFMYLVALYSTSDIVFRSFLYRENRNLPFCSLFVKATTSILSSTS